MSTATASLKSEDMCIGLMMQKTVHRKADLQDTTPSDFLNEAAAYVNSVSYKQN